MQQSDFPFPSSSLAWKEKKPMNQVIMQSTLM
jgi:hypothetical protein